MITSVGRNSTRQPMLLLTGGGLKRIDCQFVELIFFYLKKKIELKNKKHEFYFEMIGILRIIEMQCLFE